MNTSPERLSEAPRFLAGRLVSLLEEWLSQVSKDEAWSQIDEGSGGETRKGNAAT